ncbi:MAG TPA: SBBP repeat-containing protein, partial [Anaerolineales bacterium]|nr:SBBP repeat-containing protein [Anaerolineales bacterium]
TVTRIDPDLMGTNAILYSTYLGGTVIDQVFGMTLDSGGKLYLVGRSSSDDYPTRSALQAARKGAYDVIVAQIDPSLSGDASLLYSTYFGTTVTDIGYAIARDSDGNLYLTGRTYSGRFPLRDPLQYVSHSGTCGASSCYEAFVTKLKIATNELVYSTYLGGSQNDEGHGIAVDAYGRAYVTGYTRSSDFPVYNAIQSTKGPDSCAAPPCADAFLSVLEPNGQAFAYSTFLGGDQDDIANGITLDADNNVYLVGETYSTNFPTTPGAYDVINTETNKRDVFIARVTPLGAAPEQTTNHLDLAVAAGSDDAEQSASGSVSLTSSDLELVRDSNNQTVGVRFTGVSVPQGATIVNASLQFAVDETTSEATSLTIQAEASDNAATFAATSNNISGRPRTSASATWTPAAWNTVDQAGPDQRTPDLATVIQEVVNRSGWTAGNAMAIILTGTGKRVAKSYEEDALAGAPYLHIEYTLPGQLDLQITANPTSFTSAGQTITYTYTLTNTGTVALTGPYGVSDDKVSSVDCSAAQSPLGVGASTTCAGSYTTTPADVTAGSVTDTATATASAGVQNVTSNTATATVTLQIPSGPVTITYDYDLLNRLTGAEYSTGDTYTYDAVGNRLTQDSTMGGLSSTVSYGYDAAHQRMTSVNGVTYDWDANGNLRSDGVKTYTYDAANRLVAVSGQQFPVSYSYNGLGDRLQETVDGQTTTFTMDYNTGLTQALSDGTNSYIYGVDRIAQVNSGAEYFLGDALGSVRQLTNANGTITYARAYDPYGVVTSSYGSSQSAYGYTNEYTDSYIKLIYLRSRLYDPLTGRFTTKDTWQGDYNRPTSYNAWLYAYANPINLSDPSGLNPNCIHPYLSFCAFQRFTEILEENSTNGATALVNLFTDNELENMWGRYAGTTSAARLEWILGIT